MPAWWRAPLVGTLLAAVLDTAVFWALPLRAPGTLGDLGTGRPGREAGMGVALLLPFRLFIGRQLAQRRLTVAAPRSPPSHQKLSPQPALLRQPARRAAPGSPRVSAERSGLPADYSCLHKPELFRCCPARPVQPRRPSGRSPKRLGLESARGARADTGLVLPRRVYPPGQTMLAIWRSP